MQVSCPHCSQSFNAERSGIQFCPHCGGQLEVPAEAGVPVTPGAPPPGSPPSPVATLTPSSPAGEGTGVPPPPWERRAEAGGPVKSFLETFKQCLLAPQNFWGTVQPNGSMTDALFYGWIVSAIAAVLRIPLQFTNRGQAAQLIEQIQSQGNLPPEVQQQLITLIDAVTGVGVGWTLVGLIFIPLWLAIAAGLLHLCAMITGAGGQGFNATFRVFCYAVTPTVFGFHWCPAILAAIYEVVLIVLGLQVVHRTTTGKAVSAVLLPLLVCCICCCALALISGAGAALSHAR